MRLVANLALERLASAKRWFKKSPVARGIIHFDKGVLNRERANDATTRTRKPIAVHSCNPEDERALSAVSRVLHASYVFPEARDKRPRADTNGSHPYSRVGYSTNDREAKGQRYLVTLG